MLLVFVLLNLVYSTFAGISMQASQAELGANMHHSAQDQNHLTLNMSADQGCADKSASDCDQIINHMDCSASHCNPVGSLPLDSLVFAAPEKTLPDDINQHFDSISGYPPYIPPISRTLI